MVRGKSLPETTDLTVWHGKKIKDVYIRAHTENLVKLALSHGLDATGQKYDIWRRIRVYIDENYQAQGWTDKEIQKKITDGVAFEFRGREFPTIY